LVAKKEKNNFKIIRSIKTIAVLLVQSVEKIRIDRLDAKDRKTQFALRVYHVVWVDKKQGVALDLLTLHVQHALLVIQVNIGQQTLVRALQTEPAQLAHHVLRVNKKPEVALDRKTQFAFLIIKATCQIIRLLIVSKEKGRQ